MEVTEKIVKISVRNLVEFILRSGDIDNRIAGVDKDAMLLGGKIHRKIQRMMGSDYQAEVPLKIEVPCNGFTLILDGRADGVMKVKEGIVIDEIKGVMRSLEKMNEPQVVHLAQAKCYAYIYAAKNQLEEIGVQMTYCNMETEEIRRFQSVYCFEELKNWFLDVVGQYEKWARYQIQWTKKRNASIKELEFPFAYREGQKNLAVSVYRTIARKKKLFIQAPTGVGKTMATVFPAVKAVGEGLGEKIFYLTAKTITRTVAWQAFDTLKEQALRMKVLVLTAKEKTCFCEETNCNPDACPYAKGHFDRVNDAVYELLTTSDEMSREILEAQAKKWNVCPYEMSLDVSTWVDAIICDYNYAFDPNAHLRRFFGEGNSGEYLFLIDEAHNLVERARSMYSTALCKEDFLDIKKKVKTCAPKLAKKLEECNRQFLALKRECEEYEVLNSVSHIYLKLLNLVTEMDHFLEDFKEDSLKEEVLEFYFEVRMFIYIHDRLDENYVIYSEIADDGKFYIHLFCVNPAVNLQEYLGKGNSTIFFSATLLPIQYYKKLLSTGKEDYAIYAESPFDTKNRLLLLGNDVSTKYTMRTTSMYERYARYIRQTAMAKRGNYIAFFPSYRFMEDVYDAFMKLPGEAIPSIVQSPHMSEEERETFLENFEENGEEGLVGFCVMGGIFSEGIDLSKDRLIGVLIAGPGIPQVCRERELLRAYFDAKDRAGYDYAYLYPGMNKVLQSAGRVIRTEEDEGVILLLDDRFLDHRYKKVFPREWKDFKICNINSAAWSVEAFWSTRKTE